jgi:hypothetical protein
MHLDAELDVSMHAMAPMANKFGAVGGGAECERLQQCAARASQTVAGGGEADDPRFDGDLILVVAVIGQHYSAVAALMFTHD